MVKQLDKDGDGRVDYGEFAAGVADRKQPELLGALLVGRWLRIFYDDDDQVAGWALPALDRPSVRQLRGRQLTNGLWCTRWGK